jgi:hypothetical protein
MLIPNVSAGLNYNILNVIGEIMGIDACGTDLRMQCCEQIFIAGAPVCKENSQCNKSVPVWNSEKMRPNINGLKVYYSNCWNPNKLKKLGYYPLFEKEFNPPENWIIKKNEIKWDMFGDIKYYGKAQEYITIDKVGYEKLRNSSKNKVYHKQCPFFMIFC